MDRLEPEIKISPSNLYVKIMDEALPGEKGYLGLIDGKCLVKK
jgi:hypothetical protein